MNREELKVGNYVFIESNFNPRNPIEVLLEIEELNEYYATCKQVEYPDHKHIVEYNNLMPVDFTLDTLKLLGFERFESLEKIDDYAGFYLFTYQNEKYALNNKCLYRFELKTIIRHSKPYLTVSPEGDCFFFFHELQNKT
ncbi:hypothetical protein ACKW6Q_17440 [Chryseobacterium kwangjuense]|uniref:Uncharacterized protein n=1 Tax=Chryseobacterium kwangjuense TaxID=267125 RepID=A0ABW9K8C1_9FLAO